MIIFHLISLILSADPQPTFFDRYKITGEIILPYADLTIPYTVYYDGAADASYTSYYHGTSFSLASSKFRSMQIIPASYNGSNEKDCEQFGQRKSILPNLQDFKKDAHNSDCSSKIYNSTLDSCILWVKRETHLGRENTYILYTNQEMSPIRYEMYGYDTLLGSHYDQYIVVYDTYQQVGKNVVDTLIRDKIDESCPHASNKSKMHVDLISQLFFDEDEHESHFEEIRAKHGVKFASPNSKREARVKFRHSLRYITAHNSKDSSFKMVPNHKAFEQAKTACRLETRNEEIYRNSNFMGFATFTDRQEKLPQNFDWRIFGAVSPVKDQAICGSCWAFGTTGVIESHYFLRTNKSVLFSEQHLVDCSWAQNNNGCFGGLDFNSYTFISTYGLSSDEEYGGYKGEDMPCRHFKFHKYFNISGYAVVKKNEHEVMSALYHSGPISISIDASLPSFSFYSSGVYYDVDCSSSNLDHAVLLVGYGTTPGGEDYWIVKNSWSTHWGDHGYIKISRKNNTCGVMTAPTIPFLRN